MQISSLWNKLKLSTSSVLALSVQTARACAGEGVGGPGPPHFLKKKKNNIKKYTFSNERNL